MYFPRLRYALRTAYDEIAGFQFDYPLRIVPEAGPKESLHYYLFKYRKTPPHRPVMRLDSNGVARVWGRVTGVVYRPSFVAMYGLSNLNQFLETGDPRGLDIFLKQVSWLESHAIRREDGAVVWPHDFDLQEGSLLLKAPWISANVQGFVMSALVRAFRLTGRPALSDLLIRSTKVFELDWRENGIRVESEGHVVYTEAPGLPAPGIMDGFLRSLLGLYDASVETGDSSVYRLFEQGIDGLRYFLPRWDYKNKWSIYGNNAYLSPPAYHHLNRLLLKCVAQITNHALLERCVENWDPERLSKRDRAEIYARFVITKNACRIRYRTWNQRTSDLAASDGQSNGKAQSSLADFREPVRLEEELQSLAHVPVDNLPYVF
jgi:hypothetical protein